MLFFYLLIILSVIFLTNQSPHILEDIDICKVSYKFNKKKVEYYVPLYFNAEDTDIQLIFSLCGIIPNIFPNNGSCFKTCIYDKKNKFLITGKPTIETLFEVDEHSTSEITLILTDQLKCKDNGHYEITVKMRESIELFKKPNLRIENCNIIVEIFKPMSEPPCTHIVNSKDFISLEKLRGVNISIPWGDKAFHIALCGTNRNCGTGIVGCLKGGNDTVKLGSKSLQKLRYDEIDNQLKVVSSYTDEQGKTLKMEVNIKCNWEVEKFYNAKFINQSIQGRRYKFEVESSYGCVKMKPNCIVKDSNNGLIYDLRGLMQRSETKVMLPNTTKFILLNICGDLKEIGQDKNNNCERQHSQSCEIDKNTYTNKGSVSSFEITKEHSIKLSLRNGQKCNERSLYSTEIDIRCSFSDKAPTVIKSENCLTQILCETTKGCPKFQNEADSCSIKTHLGIIDISNLHAENDRIHSFSPSEKFIFNVCGKLHSECSSETEVSACYVNNGTEYIIGWNKPKFYYTNGRLQLKYFGVKYFGNRSTSLTINLYCSYAKVPSKTKLYKRDSSTFEAEIYSLSACLNHDVEDCELKTKDMKYNLKPLIANETNYKIQDNNDKNLTYFINVCRSLINENGLIPGNSMIYLLDKSKPHIWDKYVSLGKIARPSISSDGKLVINSILGSTCYLGKDYSSVIKFECSTRENEGPKLLEKKDCHFEFLWRTKYACPINRSSCLLQENIEVPGDELKFEIKSNRYKFNLCADKYEMCKNGICIEQKLTRNIILENNAKYVEVMLENPSECSKDVLTVNISLQCDRGQTAISILTINEASCQVDMRVKSLLMCNNGNNFMVREVDEYQKIIPQSLNTSGTFSETKEHGVFINTTSESKIAPSNNDMQHVSTNTATESRIAPPNSDMQHVSINTTTESRIAPPNNDMQHVKYNTVKIGTKTFNLKNIEMFTVTGKSTYIINFNGKSNSCEGKICRDSTAVLPFIENSPEVFSTERLVTLNFTVEGKCILHDNLTKSLKAEDLKIRIQLVCSQTREMTISEETSCLIGFVYYSPQNCEFIKSASGISVVALSVGVTLVLIAFIFGYLLYRKNKKKCLYNSINSSERINHSKLL